MSDRAQNNEMRGRATAVWRLAATLALLAAACCAGDDSHAFVAAILVESLPIYYKTQVWGRNGFSAVLSLNKDAARVPLPGDWDCCPEDYKWPAQEPPVLVFRASGGMLHIWDPGGPTGGWRPPLSGTLPAFVTFHPVTILEVQRMIESPGEYGVSVLYGWDLPYAPLPVDPVPVSRAIAEQLRRRTKR